MSAVPVLIMIVIEVAILTVSIFGIPLLFIHAILLFPGKRRRLEKAKAKARRVLMEGEADVHIAGQHRLHAIYRRREILITTDSRFVIVSRGWFGGFDMFDFQWKDLEDVRIKENFFSGILGSDLRFDVQHKGLRKTSSINGLPSETASKIYAFAQRQEQAWEEKRRIRDNEDRRASSGGIFLGQDFGQSQPSRRQEDSGDVMLHKKLSDSKRMLDEGLINDAEYEEIKSKILARMA